MIQVQNQPNMLILSLWDEIVNNVFENPKDYEKDRIFEIFSYIKNDKEIKNLIIQYYTKYKTNKLNILKKLLENPKKNINKLFKD